MDFNYSYRFTSKAEQDLDEILHYITYTLCSPLSAKNLSKKIFEHINTVRMFPESGAIVENEFLTVAVTVRKIIVDNYIVYYTVSKQDNAIIIIRIVYGKRNLDEIMRSI